MSICSPSSKRIRHCNARVARISRLYITCRRKIRRFEAEPEAALRIVPVEKISYPDFCAPAIPRVARLQVCQHPGRCTLIVRGIEVEVVLAGEIHAREQSLHAAVFDAQVVLVLRCVGLLTTVQVA